MQIFICPRMPLIQFACYRYETDPIALSGVPHFLLVPSINLSRWPNAEWQLWDAEWLIGNGMLSK